MNPDVVGDVSDCDPGSISSVVRNEVSDNPAAVDVRARKRSRRLF